MLGRWIDWNVSYRKRKNQRDLQEAEDPVDYVY